MAKIQLLTLSSIAQLVNYQGMYMLGYGTLLGASTSSLGPSELWSDVTSYLGVIYRRRVRFSSLPCIRI
jgi:hypothetical protein